jgi:hypothetical protein
MGREALSRANPLDKFPLCVAQALVLCAVVLIHVFQVDAAPPNALLEAISPSPSRFESHP